MGVTGFYRSKSFAMDLGNNNTLLMDTNGVLLSQPSCIVFDVTKKSVKAVGEEAYSMFEKTHENLRPVKPLRDGVIADFDSASEMIRQMVSKTQMGKRWFSGFDQIISGVPYSTTEVERRALRDAIDQFNPGQRYLLFEPLAAALGMGINIREPEGKMLIDIGGGITEIVIISLSGIVAFKSIKVGGDYFDREIQDYFRREHKMIIGTRTAEQVKFRLGAVKEEIDPAPEAIDVKGKDIREGIPVSKTISHREIAKVLIPAFEQIESATQNVLEQCPPELAADIYQNGIWVTGGGSILRGLKGRLESTLGLPVQVDKHPLLSVSKGASLVLRDQKKYKAILL